MYKLPTSTIFLNEILSTITIWRRPIIACACENNCNLFGIYTYLKDLYTKQIWTIYSVKLQFVIYLFSAYYFINWIFNTHCDLIVLCSLQTIFVLKTS